MKPAPRKAGRQQQSSCCRYRLETLACCLFAVLIWDLFQLRGMHMRVTDAKPPFLETRAAAALHNYTNPIVANQEDNVHKRLAVLSKQLAKEFSQTRTRHFSRYGVPHFPGGWALLRDDMLSRNWTYHMQSEVMAMFNSFGDNAQLDSSATPKFDIVFSSCLLYTPQLWGLKHQRLIGLVSGEPNERRAVLKANFYTATRTWFRHARPGCDYRMFHPETRLLRSKQDCLEFDKDWIRPGEVWFLKQSNRLSFGYGITTMSKDSANEALNCDKLRFSPPLLMQKGVDNIFTLWDGRVTQGRAFLLVSSYNPTRAWFYIGYYIVADKERHVANSRANVHAAHLSFADLLHDKTEEEMQLAKHNIKLAALQVFHILSSQLGQPDENSFSLFGFDYVLQQDLSVKVFEANCNCVLYSAEENQFEAGAAQMEVSERLVTTMMDIVLASNLENAKEYTARLQQFLVNSSVELGSLKASNALDRFGIRDYWELIYSESPSYVYDDLGACAAAE